ncbi:hypothetical protein VKT23_010262 [Stygiomarasmius scandens]|uniref:Uncharacterized protein n=1 Tax=Marasmiellus scandens TaxID=2682957 RepID=A0ABR1JGK5_9AGAR
MPLRALEQQKVQTSTPPRALGQPTVIQSFSRSTRSGREFAGLPRAQQQHLSFDTFAHIQHAQVSQAEDDDVDDENHQGLCSYPPKPSSQPKKNRFRFIPIAKLAGFWRKLTVNRYRSHPYTPDFSKSAAERKKEKNRLRDRAHRATKRLQEQNELQTTLKGYQRRKVQGTNDSAVTTTYIEPCGAWTGPAPRESSGTGTGRLFTLREIRAYPGMQVLAWNPRESHLLRDNEGRPLVLLGGWRTESWMNDIVIPLQYLLQTSGASLNIPSLRHRRGEYPTVRFGISFGGGQQRPANLALSSLEAQVLGQLRQEPAMIEVARYCDYLMRCYFPKVYTLYRNVLDALKEENADLDINFEECCFAAAAINFRKACTFRHRDFLNLLFGLCAVFSLGDFDYKKGGHLILWDLGLIVEFPPGCVILIPSAMIEHSNTALRMKDVRHSITFFSASGLFRWVHNGGMSDKDFVASAPPDVLKEWYKHRSELWKTGLALLGGV